MSRRGMTTCALLLAACGGHEVFSNEVGEESISALVDGRPATWSTAPTAGVSYSTSRRETLALLASTTDGGRIEIRLTPQVGIHRCAPWTTSIGLVRPPRASRFEVQRESLDSCTITLTRIGAVGEAVEGTFEATLSVYDGEGFGTAEVANGRFRIRRSPDVGQPYCSLSPTSRACQ